jgi:hypothetical protein
MRLNCHASLAQKSAADNVRRGIVTGVTVVGVRVVELCAAS